MIIKALKDQLSNVKGNTFLVKYFNNTLPLFVDKILLLFPPIFEVTADKYPFRNELAKADLEGFGIKFFDGFMILVLGISLQNKDLLKFFHDAIWNVIGLEMEGAHYQKAIQSASRIRGNISEDVKVKYASDNLLETVETLAS
jgi:hypothetical protein